MSVLLFLFLLSRGASVGPRSQPGTDCRLGGLAVSQFSRDVHTQVREGGISERVSACFIQSRKHGKKGVGWTVWVREQEIELLVSLVVLFVYKGFIRPYNHPKKNGSDPKTREGESYMVIPGTKENDGCPFTVCCLQQLLMAGVVSNWEALSSLVFFSFSRGVSSNIRKTSSSSGMKRSREWMRILS